MERLGNLPKVTELEEGLNQYVYLGGLSLILEPEPLHHLTLQCMGSVQHRVRHTVGT